MRVPDLAFDYLAPAACYFAGLLASDGSVGGAEPARVSIKLIASDVAIIRALKAFLGSDATISYHPARGGSRPQTGIQVRSVALVNRLTALGIGPRKSLSLHIQSEKLLESADFWRGVIDGDGTVMIARHVKGDGRVFLYPRVQLVSGSESFILQFSDFLHARDIRATVRAEQTRAPGKSHWTFTSVVSNQADVVRLASLLYGDCGELAIRRKKVAAKNIMDLFRKAPKRKPVITPEIRSQVVDLYTAGKAATQIGYALRLTTTTVTNVLKLAGVSLRSRSGNYAVKQYSAARIIRTYKQLHSTRRTARVLQISRDTVRKVLKDSGVLV